MTKYAILLTALLHAAGAQACSVFMMSDKDHVYAGNNEDDPPTRDFLSAKITFTPAGNAQKLGSMVYSFPDNVPEGGMNTAGLFFDILQLPPTKNASYPSGTPDFPGPPGALLSHILANCTSVEEATAQLKKYKLPGIEEAQVFFGDKNGNGAVISVGQNGKIAVKMKTSPFFLATNYNLNDPSSKPADDRPKLAQTYWQKNPEVSKTNARTMLSALHFEGLPSTVYSNLYDLKQGEMVLYNFHNFADSVKINLKAELARHGARTVPVSSLFPVQPFSVTNTDQIRCCIDQLKGNLGADCKASPVSVPKRSPQPGVPDAGEEKTAPAF